MYVFVHMCLFIHVSKVNLADCQTQFCESNGIVTRTQVMPYRFARVFF